MAELLKKEKILTKLLWVYDEWHKNPKFCRMPVELFRMQIEDEIDRIKRELFAVQRQITAQI